ncbi:MAG: glutamate dehydrogenase [Chlamydiae bacterium]|nr:glutamate dehydrogenase [Chlamydiota bacterium]
MDPLLAKQQALVDQLHQWLHKNMPRAFVETVDKAHFVRIAEALCLFKTQDSLIALDIPYGILVLALSADDTELQVLQKYATHSLQNFHSFLSLDALPHTKNPIKLKICRLIFFPTTRNCYALFQHGLSSHTLAIIEELHRVASHQDNCQYHLEENKTGLFSLIFAWKGVSKHHFLPQLLYQLFHRKISIQSIRASYTTASSTTLLVMIEGRSSPENLSRFVQELDTLPFFTRDQMPRIHTTYAEKDLLQGDLVTLLKSLTYLLHQTLSPFDPMNHSLTCVEEYLCHRPELVCLLLQAFAHKFHPDQAQFFHYQEQINRYKDTIQQQEDPLENRPRRATLLQAASVIESCVRTNFYVRGKTALGFVLDPKVYFAAFPYRYEDKFQSLPFLIYFLQGSCFFGFHIRFADLARGGLRTVIPSGYESMLLERSSIFCECYQLAYTQQKKNKDIPEGGAKGVLFLEVHKQIEQEQELTVEELCKEGVPQNVAVKQLEALGATKQQELLYHAQRSYIRTLLTLINSQEDGSLREKRIIDYLERPEYLYLGPDENMHNIMIEWIADYSREQAYPPGGAFISSKPHLGINHKEFGVTSFGVHVYMEELLQHLHINPAKDIFTIKMTGGPDGDVAGNQMLNLFRYYPKTAKLLTTLDISGTLFDPEGMNLEALQTLFFQQKPIADYPLKNLSPGGFLLDKRTKQSRGSQEHQVLCTRNIGGKLVQEWLSPYETSHILHYTVHKTKADLFIPAGGRPRTLHDTNYQDFLDEAGHPTARGIVEGANLYLTEGARRALEERGVLIIKDSSANKGGVICSSFEVLCNLCLSSEEFLCLKPFLVEEVLHVIAERAHDEAHLLLTHAQSPPLFLTEISDLISSQMLLVTKRIAEDLQEVILPYDNPGHPLHQVLLHYCLPTLRAKASLKIVSKLPPSHKKAIIARHLASTFLYQQGILPPSSAGVGLHEALAFFTKKTKM